MDLIAAVWPAIMMLVLYILLFWLIFRAARALERIADKIERIVDNENTRE